MPMDVAIYVRAVSTLISMIYKEAKGPIRTAIEKMQSNDYAESMGAAIARIGTVKTLWSPGTEVQLRDFYHPLRIENESTNIFSLDPESGSKKVSSVDDLPGSLVVVQGIVGQGKSMFLRYLAMEAMDNKNSKKIPIFIELRTLSARSLLMTEIYRFFENSGLRMNDDIFSHLAKSGKIAIFLDAFDELQNDIVKDVIKEIQSINFKFPDLNVIITSRPDNEIQKITGVKIFNLSPLISSEIDQFLLKLGIEKIRRMDIIDAIQNSPSKIIEMAHTPLMLTLIVITYVSIRDIPPTLPEFFKKLFEVVFTRHDRLKPGFFREHHTKLPESKLKDLFSAFCFNSFQSGFGRTLDSDQFRESFEYSQHVTSGCACDLEGFRADIVKVACLMLEEGVGLTTFLHNSIAEYFAAEFISDCTEDTSREFYGEAISDYLYWSPILNFLHYIDSYRYSKFYVLEYINELKVDISETDFGRNKEKTIKFIVGLIPDCQIEVAKRKNGGIRVDSAGPISSPKSKEHRNFVNSIFPALLNEMQYRIQFNQIALLAETGVPGDVLLNTSREAHISLKSVLEILGTEFLYAQILKFHAEVDEVLQNAKNCTMPKERNKIIMKRNRK